MQPSYISYMIPWHWYRGGPYMSEHVQLIPRERTVLQNVSQDHGDRVISWKHSIPILEAPNFEERLAEILVLATVRSNSIELNGRLVSVKKTSDSLVKKGLSHRRIDSVSWLFTVKHK